MNNMQGKRQAGHQSGLFRTLVCKSEIIQDKLIR